MRDAHERAILEMGKTSFGNSNFDKRDKLCESNPIDKSNKDYFILSLDGGGLRYLRTPQAQKTPIETDHACILQRSNIDYSSRKIGGSVP